MSEHDSEMVKKYGPALRHQSDWYPEHFDGRVPRRVRMLMTVRPDFPFLLPAERRDMVAERGATYEVQCNSHGAVTAILGDGEKELLGLKPAEFEIVEWHDTETVLRETRAWAAKRETALMNALKCANRVIKQARDAIDAGAMSAADAREMRDRLAAWDASLKAVPRD